MLKYNKQLVQCHKIIVVRNIDLSHEIILTASSSIVESLDGLFQTFQKAQCCHLLIQSIWLQNFGIQLLSFNCHYMLL